MRSRAIVPVAIRVSSDVRNQTNPRTGEAAATTCAARNAAIGNRGNAFTEVGSTAAPR